jgi:cytidylate kinase
VEEQIAKWHLTRSEQKKAAVQPGPVITVSREPGSGGSEIARRLARDLDMDLIGAQIIQQVAERAEMTEKVIESLDEKTVKMRDMWLASLFRTRHLWPDEYLQHLTKVIGTIGKQGNSVIVGRGANFILPPEETFRLRLIAPREIRIQNVMRERAVDFETAERYVFKTEGDREAFLRKHFHADWEDPIYYDLVVNTGNIGLEGSVSAIEAAFLAWKEARRNERPPSREKAG